MKNLIFVILITISIAAQAQRFNGGLLLGINASQVDGDRLSGYNKFGLTFGAFSYTEISSTIDLQLEIKYIGKGAATSSKESVIKYANQLNYIEIPLILRFKTDSRIDIEAGLAAAYLFNNTIKYDGDAVTRDDIFKKTDFSGIAGILYKANNNLAISMRISYSVLSIRDAPGEIDQLIRNGVYNNLLSIALFYTFGNKE